MNYLIKRTRATRNMYFVNGGVITYVSKGDLIPLSTGNKKHWSNQPQQTL